MSLFESNLNDSSLIKGFLKNKNKEKWSPLKLKNLFIWLDASDNNSIINNFNKVVEWKDKSGNNNNLIQSEIELQPSISSFDGNNSVYFDLNILHTLDSNFCAKEHNVFLILKAVGGEDWLGTSSTSPPNSVLLQQNYNKEFKGHYWSKSGACVTIGNKVNDGITLYHQQAQNGFFKIFKNNIQEGVSLNYNSDSNNVSPIILGSRNNSTGHSGIFHLFEVIIYVGILNDEDVESIYNYAIEKWNII